MLTGKITHTVVINDKIIVRKEGERVGGLLRSWRELRREKPQRFKSGVLSSHWDCRLTYRQRVSWWS